MQIYTRYERKDPKNLTSEIINRGFDFQTILKPECVRKITQRIMPAHTSDIFSMGVIGKHTRFRMSLDDAQTPAFPLFLYEIMNLEDTPRHWNG